MQEQILHGEEESYDGVYGDGAAIVEDVAIMIDITRPGGGHESGNVIDGIGYQAL